MLKKLSIRKVKPNYSDARYDIFENLDDYASKIFELIKINPRNVDVLGGETSVIIKVKDKGGNIVIKINPFDNDLYASNYFYTKLEDTNIPIPKVLYFDDSHKIIPYDFQVLEFLNGADLRKIPHKYHKKAGFLISKILSEIHKIRVDGFGWPLPKGGWGAKSWLEALRGNYFDTSMAKKGEIFSQNEIREIESKTFFNKKLNITEPRLIHSDVGRGNSLYTLSGTNLRLIGFIDPNGIIGGDPMLDLAMGTNDEDDFSRGMWEGYTKNIKLTQEESYRYKYLQLLTLYWSTCWYYATGRGYKSLKNKTLNLSNALF